MAQVVVWARREHLDRHRPALSDAIHGAVMAALDYPPDKRFHRFVGLDAEDFVHPPDRGTDYTIIEISIFAGRSEEARRRLIAELFDRLQQEIGIDPHQRGDHHHRDSAGQLGHPRPQRRRPRSRLSRRRLSAAVPTWSDAFR